MSDAMSNAELLSPGLTARDLGPGEVEKMFGPATTPLERLRAAGMVDESNPAEMGGGGGAVDAIDDWIIKTRGGYDKLLQQIEQNKWGDNLVWKLSDGTQISVAEVRRRAAAVASPPEPQPSIEKSSGKKERTAQERWITRLSDPALSADELKKLKIIILRARALPQTEWDSQIRRLVVDDGVSLDSLQQSLDAEIIRREENEKKVKAPPVKQVTPAVVDWKENLSGTQRQALMTFEQRLQAVDVAVLAQLAQEIVSFQSHFVKTGQWVQNAWVTQENASNFLRLIKEKLSPGEGLNNSSSEQRLSKTTGINRF